MPGGFHPDAPMFMSGAIYPQQQPEEEITVHSNGQAYDPQAGGESEFAHYFDQQVAEDGGGDLYAQYYERQL